jgi:3'5'-cyclic nucleotide phosphodiesterase
MHYLLQQPEFPFFTDLEMLAMYVAASVHDYDHPGVNNNFLVQTRDSRALLYNDRSVLENHHCASAFKILQEFNFAIGMDRKTYAYWRGFVVDMVLATDLAHHFSLLTAFKTKVFTSYPGHTEQVRPKDESAG